MQPSPVAQRGPGVPVPSEQRHGGLSLEHLRHGWHRLCRHTPLVVVAHAVLYVAGKLRSEHVRGEVVRMWQIVLDADRTLSLVTVVACVALLAVAVMAWLMLQGRPVYLVDFAVYRPPDSWKWSKAWHANRTEACKAFTPDNQEFQAKILARSGLGDETYLPPSLASQPPSTTISDARWEFEQVCFSSIKDVLAKAGITPAQVGVLVVNCSLFNPTPSLCAMVMNHFKMSGATISYNIGGMGCSAGVIAVDLARQVLQLKPNSYALVVSTENITQNWYFGNSKGMLIPNCIFRVGGAAILLSNKRKDAWRAKYELQHVVRTNLAANDAAFTCVYEQEDDQGQRGVKLSKELMNIAGEALRANITTLGPKVLPVSEQLLFAANMLARKVLGKKALAPYVPDFKLAFDHVCIHTGGRGVVDEIEKQLRLTPEMVEPSRATLYRYGNVSSSSIWYVLSFIESMVGLQRGDMVWQLGFGSGFKCNSAVWKAMRPIKDMHRAWEGFDLDRMRADVALLPHH